MPDRTHTPTLQDVAELSGVSTATVSRCLNSPEQVMPATRARVLAAVEQLGYAPNFGARALAARRTNTVGAVIPTMENAIFTRGLQAFQEALNERGFTLLVASSQYRPELEARQVRNLIARGADALLLIGHYRGGAVHEELARRGIPAVVAWAFEPGAVLPGVGFDNAASMRALTREVLARGHSRIGYITAATRENDRARDRLAGARDAVRDAQLPNAAFQVVETSYSIENGARAFDRLMAERPRPTAVMCGNDVLAAGAVRAARQAGLAVPGDVSITGFDDIEIAEVVDPPLTTVHVPHRDMGRAAADMLLDAIDSGERPDSIELPTRLMLRGSLGPAPGRRGAG